MANENQNKKFGIIFDLDGTLWDSSDAVTDSWNEALDQIPGNKYHMTNEFMCSLMGKTMTDIAYEFFKDETPERAMELMDICMDYENKYIEMHGGILFPKLRETLEILKKDYFLAIVSNCQDGYIQAFLKYHELGDLFDDFESFGNTKLVKGENIKLVVERNGLQKAVYVGDVMGDYNSTMEAGLPFIHAAYGFGTVPEGTPRITAFEELPEKADSLLR